MDIPGKVLATLGVRPRDVPAALVIFNGMLWIEWAAVFVACLRFQPLRSFALTSTGARWRSLLSKRFPSYSKTERYCLRAANKMSESRFMKPLPRMFGIEAENFTFSLAETVLLYNVGFLCWLPTNCAIAKLYCDYRAEHGTLTRAVTNRHMLEHPEDEQERLEELERDREKRYGKKKLFA
eukprot:g819.t1